MSGLTMLELNYMIEKVKTAKDISEAERRERLKTYRAMRRELRKKIAEMLNS